MEKKNSGLRVGGVNVILSPILMSNDDYDQFFGRSRVEELSAVTVREEGGLAAAAAAAAAAWLFEQQRSRERVPQQNSTDKITH